MQPEDKRVNVKMIKHARCEQCSARLHFYILLDRHTYIYIQLVLYSKGCEIDDRDDDVFCVG